MTPEEISIMNRYLELDQAEDHLNFVQLGSMLDEPFEDTPPSQLPKQGSPPNREGKRPKNLSPIEETSVKRRSPGLLPEPFEGLPSTITPNTITTYNTVINQQICQNHDKVVAHRTCL